MNAPILPEGHHLPDGTKAPLKEEVSSNGSLQTIPPGPVVPPFYAYEEEIPESPAAPFGVSQEMPEVQSSDEMVSPTPVAPNNKESRQPRFSLMFIAIIVCVVVIVGFLVMSALAAPSPPIEMRKPANQPTKTQGRANTPTNPQPGNGQTQGNGQGPNDVPSFLPDSWTAAGLSTSDAVEASRTAMTFTDREMSLDFRSAGTRNNHGGTFTAATFLLTPAGMQRFQQNDLRVINNTLWDNVQQEKLVQSVVNAQPLLFMALSSGQNQPFFAWVDVSFQLYQSKLDGNGKQVEGFEINPNLNAPRLHRMVVLLVHVPPQNAGANPAMGGTGWLVSTYALDLPAGNTVGVTMPA